MRSSLIRTLLMIALVASGLLAVAGGAAAQVSEPGGSGAPPTPPPDARFQLEDTDVLGAGADLDDAARTGIPVHVDCKLVSGQYEWRTDCGRLHVTARVTSSMQHILGLSSRNLFNGFAKAPKLGVDDPPSNNESEGARDFHVLLSSAVKAKLKPVGYIKYVAMTGDVTAPNGTVVKLKSGDGDWGGRKTPGGIVCPTKDVDLTIRPHSHRPYCPGPGGFGGIAKPSWYQG